MLSFDPLTSWKVKYEPRFINDEWFESIDTIKGQVRRFIDDDEEGGLRIYINEGAPPKDFTETVTCANDQRFLEVSKATGEEACRKRQN